MNKLWKQGRAIPWAVLWEVGRSLWFNSRDRVNRNLSEKERREFAGIVRKRRGRPWNLAPKERDRLVFLTKKAATGTRDPSWNEVGTSIVTLLPPRLLTALWNRFRQLTP